MLYVYLHTYIHMKNSNFNNNGYEFVSSYKILRFYNQQCDKFNFSKTLICIDEIFHFKFQCLHITKTI